MASYKVNKRPKDDTSDDEKEEDELVAWLKKFGLLKLKDQFAMVGVDDFDIIRDVFSECEDSEFEAAVKDFTNDETWADPEGPGAKMKDFHKRLFKRGCKAIMEGKYPPQATPPPAKPVESKEYVLY